MQDHDAIMQQLVEVQQDRDLLHLRLEAAKDELERVGQQAAGMMGHANEGQKLSYMEGMRREMAIVKHVSE
jgi:hypothetical protein